MNDRNLAEAGAWFGISLAAAAIGLVLCGSGAPTILCWIFFTVPSLISLVGYPLRYGRGTTVTRLIYAMFGMALLIVAYQQLIIHGKFGSLDADVCACAFGFAAGSLGLAAMLGAMVNTIAGCRRDVWDPASIQ